MEGRGGCSERTCEWKNGWKKRLVPVYVCVTHLSWPMCLMVGQACISLGNNKQKRSNRKRSHLHHQQTNTTCMCVRVCVRARRHKQITHTHTTRVHYKTVFLLCFEAFSQTWYVRALMGGSGVGPGMVLCSTMRQLWWVL